MFFLAMASKRWRKKSSMIGLPWSISSSTIAVFSIPESFDNKLSVEIDLLSKRNEVGCLDSGSSDKIAFIASFDFLLCFILRQCITLFIFASSRSITV